MRSFVLLLAFVGCAKAQPLRVQVFTVPYPLESQAPIITNETNFYHYGGASGITNRYNTAACPEAAGMTIEQVLAAIGTPAFNANVNCSNFRTSNAAGSVWNHALFWNTMGPYASQTFDGNASEALKAAVAAAFGSYQGLVASINTTSARQWGPGWTWLCSNATGSLSLWTTALQDNPLMKTALPNDCSPIMNLDLWEHAYYLSYYTNRVKWTVDFMQLVNWAKVSEFYELAKQGVTPPVITLAPVSPAIPPPPSPEVPPPSPEVPPPSPEVPPPSPEVPPPSPEVTPPSGVCSGSATGTVDVQAAGPAFNAYVDSGSKAFVRHDPAASGVQLVLYGGEGSVRPSDDASRTVVDCTCCEIVVGLDVTELEVFVNGLGESGTAGGAISVPNLSIRTDGQGKFISDAVVANAGGSMALTLWANGASVLALTNPASEVDTVDIPLADGMASITYAGTIKAGSPTVGYQGGASQINIGA